MTKHALITGIQGQDAYYLANYLLTKGYQVYGMYRHASMKHTPICGVTYVCGDLIDQSSLINVLEITQPDEIYNLAAMSFVPVSWQQPILTHEVTGLGAIRLLDAARQVCPMTKFYQSSSSEMFGSSPPPQGEKTLFHPRSPYGCAKLNAHMQCINYRESYGMFIACGILHNHESPRRGLEFVTRKISYGVAQIKLGLAKELRLGNLEAKRDWGFAGDYVRAMHLMLQQDIPDDYVIGTGAAHSVEDFVKIAFSHVGLNWKDYCIIDSKFYRPADVNYLQADASKANHALGWTPSVNFNDLVTMMVDSDISLLQHK